MTIDDLISDLEEVAEYFAVRADADLPAGASGFKPNDAMRHQMTIVRALAALSALSRSGGKQ